MGVVDIEPMKTMLVTIGDCLTKKECREFFKEAKPGTDGRWPYDGKLNQTIS